MKEVTVSKMLSSWKEIAHFFGKGVRTVQRWEKTLDLPIHRPPGAPSNVVLARVSDLEEWMHRGSVAAIVQGESGGADRAISASLADLEGEVTVLAEKLHARASFTVDATSAPERIGAIRAAISHLTHVASSVEVQRAA